MLVTWFPYLLIPLILSTQHDILLQGSLPLSSLRPSPAGFFLALQLLPFGPFRRLLYYWG